MRFIGISSLFVDLKIPAFQIHHGLTCLCIKPHVRDWAWRNSLMCVFLCCRWASESIMTKTNRGHQVLCISRDILGTAYVWQNRLWQCQSYPDISYVSTCDFSVKKHRIPTMHFNRLQSSFFCFRSTLSVSIEALISPSSINTVIPEIQLNRHAN